MIFVSTSCLRNEFIKDSVKELALAGIQNIELSGGTKLYPDLEKDLLELKEKFNLTYRCHNYFPPPSSPFVLNLASLDDEMFELSFKHVESALELSQRLGSTKFGFHAGFLINIGLDEIGKPIKEKPLFERSRSIERFTEAVLALKSKTGISLYLENNVLSEANFKNYKGVNPLLMTESKEIVDLLRRLEVPLLLDIAHLKVSAKTLNLNLKDELAVLIPESDYIHVSDNDGTEDSNDVFSLEGDLFNFLRNFNLKDKDFTVEVYSGLDNVLKSRDAIEELING